MSIPVRTRQFIERQIIGALVAHLLAAGYAVSVDNGEDETKPFITYDPILKALMQTDEDTLYVWRVTKAQETLRFGWVKCIYGNDGPDVISDYTTNLQPYMGRADQLSNYWSDEGPFVPPPFIISV